MSGGAMALAEPGPASSAQPVEIRVDDLSLDGILSLPAAAHGLVVLVDVPGDEGGEPHHAAMARALEAAGFGTLRLNLLTPAEHAKDRGTGYWRFEIDLLSRRLRQAIEWLAQAPVSRRIGLGCMASNTSTAAVLTVAAQLPDRVRSVVSYSGRPDFAGEALARLAAPTLLIVGEKDRGILALNQEAFEHIGGTKELTIVHQAGHCFEEPGTWDRVIALTIAWFQAHLHRPRKLPPEA